MDSGRLMRTLRLGLIAIAVLLSAAAALTLYNLHALFESRQRSFAVRQVVDALTAFQRTIIDAETGQRGFLITGDDSYLAPYQDALSKVDDELDQLARLALAESVPPEVIAELRSATAETLAELIRTVEMRRTDGFEAARARIVDGVGKTLMDRVRSLSETLRAAEVKLLLERRASLVRCYEIAEWSAVFGGAVGLMSLLAFWLLTLRQISRLNDLVRTTHRQEEQLRVTLASIGDGVITTDDNGRVTYLNGIAETLTGWPFIDAVGRPLEEIFPIVNEDTRQIVGNPARRVLQDGVIVGLANHTVLIARDGVEHLIDDSAGPIRDADRQMIGVVLTFRDVSDRRKDEKALRDANEKIHLSLQAGAIIGVWIWEIQNDRVMMDDRLAAIFSVDPMLAAGGLSIQRYLDAIHPDDIARVRVLIEEAVQNGTPYRAEYRLRPASGFLWVEASGRVEYDDDGKPLRFPGVLVDITERRNTERQLALAQSAGGIGTFDWIAGSDYLTVSDEYCRIWGLSPRERIPIDELIAMVHPDDRDQLGPARLTNANPVEHAEFRITRADTGAQRWIARRGQAIDVEETGVTLFAGVVYDITERKRFEDELKASEALFRTLAQAMPNFVWTAKPDGELDWTNDWVYDYTGAPAGTMNGAGWSSIVHPDDLPVVAERWATAVSSANIYEAEFRLRRVDSSYRWHLTRALPIFDIDGKVRLWVGTNTDIEDQKAAVQTLAQMNEALGQQVAARTADRDRIWRLSTDIMLIARFDGVIAAANPAWTLVLGWAEQEMSGRNIFELMHPEDVPRARTIIESLVEGATNPRIDIRYRHRDGSYRWIAWAMVAGSGLINAVGRDFTAEKLQAEALAATQDALRQSQKMEAVGQLTGGLAHDFNNLLGAISGSLELLDTRVSQGRIEELGRYIGSAQDAARRAAALTHRLLAFSRRQSLESKPTDLNRLMAGMDDLIRRTVGPEIDVEFIGAGGLWPVLIDRNQLENVLLNLCINARDAMPGGGRLTIETANKWLDERAARERDLPPGQYLSLCVTDTGTGMTPDVIAHAFDPFFTTKPLGMGTGLGLSMTFGFVRQSGGQVRIYSELGQGTTMCLYLPRYHGDESTEDAAPKNAEAQGTEAGFTVLVVDDEPIIRSLIIEVLEDLGYTTLEAGDGAAGLKILRSDAIIDLLITDVGLPGGINGRQLADGGRAVRPELKILFITGYAENAVVRNGHLERGMQVLTKPFAIADLSARIASLLAT